MNEILQQNIGIKNKTYQTEDHIVEIAYTFGQAKKKYKLLKYIDDAYLDMLKHDGYTGDFIAPIAEPYHELRGAICNALFRNIILEIYSIFFDERSDVLSSYVINALKFVLPDFIDEYNKIQPLLKKYRDKLLAHKAVIEKRAEHYGYKHTQLNDLMGFSERLFDWFICYSVKNIEISSENRMRIEHYKKGSLDYKNDGTIDFFMKRVAGISKQEISAKIMDKMINIAD